MANKQMKTLMARITAARQRRSEMMIDRMGLEVPTGVSFSAWLEFLKKLGSAVSGDLAKYRQELRDIPQQEGFPYCVVFPTKK